MARLNQDNVVRARSLLALYPQKRSALVPLLHLVQEQDGYLTPEGLEDVAELLDLTPAEVRGTASFYDMFHLEPVGRYLVAVCTNIACMLAGAYELLEHIEATLGVSPGGTTEDGAFTLEDAECLALCGNAPCLTVNWRYFGDMTAEQWDALAGDLKAGRLENEVPPHGTLCRVQRSVGLTAGIGGGGAVGTGDGAVGDVGVAVGAGDVAGGKDVAGDKTARARRRRPAGPAQAGPGSAPAAGTTATAGDQWTTVGLGNSRTTPAVASTILAGAGGPSQEAGR